MIDTERDELLSLKAARELCPRVDGKRPSLAALWRWCQKGNCGVRLEFVRVGRQIATTRPALERFFHECAKASQRDLAKEKAPRLRTASPKALAMADADKRLQALGVAV